MKNHLLFFFFVAFFFVSCNSFEESQSIRNARFFYENHAETISLPYVEPFTKSTNYFKNVYPDWKKAKISSLDGKKIVEVPLSGSIRIIGSILTVKNGAPSLTLGATASYLVVSSTDEITKMYVETFIEKGKKSTMTAVSDRSNVIGFQILSELNGKIVEKKGFSGGKDFKLDQTICRHNMEKTPLDFVGVHVGYSVLTKGGGGGEGGAGCPTYMDFFCSVCGEYYFGDLNDFDLQCPLCKGYYYSDYHGQSLCSYCWQSAEECKCNPDLQECSPCGRVKGNCNGCGGDSSYCSCE